MTKASTRIRELSNLNASTHSTMTLLHSGCWHQTRSWGEMQWKYFQDTKWNYIHSALGLIIPKLYPSYLPVLRVPWQFFPILSSQLHLSSCRKGMFGNLIVFCWSLILTTVNMVEGNRPIPELRGSHPTHRRLRIWKTYAIKQIETYGEYQDMLPRHQLVLSSIPGQRPIGS